MGLRNTAALLLALVVCAGCAGEVTDLDFGQGTEEDFERFRSEIQPVLENEETAPVFRNCAAGGCHGDNAGNLLIVASPSEDELIENFRQFRGLVDAADPDASPILSEPLTGEGHPLMCFEGEQDCCYLILRAFVAGEDAPDCLCGSLAE